ncbi:glycoside hydrolase family 99-like domain-containing protein [Spirosoma flavum]|uniref:Glycoside hydrolase family 99-like domain-containing protein n=1 Tax=Spirosoma flavum TaxID=2048557 RepID=A0ABW6AQ44_9BACT
MKNIHFLSTTVRRYILLSSIVATAGIFLSLYVYPGLDVARQTKPAIQLGAYYFDGWSGLTHGHLTEALMDSFPERKPTWGWITSTPNIMQKQIDAAADAGLSFFSFCWYSPNSTTTTFQNDPLNRALKFYLKAPNQKRLKFCLMVANHSGFFIGPSEWPRVSQAWIDLFKQPQYVKVNGRPLLIFFSISTLIQKFGTSQAVHQAFDSLRTAAQAQGLPGVTIAACLSSSKPELAQAQECGFDVLTGYNYHGAGFKQNDQVVPIDSLLAGSRRVWNRFEASPLPYIPVATLNWDPRPWASTSRSYAQSSRYTGYSPQSVYQAIRDARDWVDLHPDKTTRERLVLAYAWNENGEGAWLTPSANQGDNLLNGVRRAVKP